MPPRNVIPPVVLTLALMVTMRFVSVAPADMREADAYHARVRQAAFAIPQAVGPWRGADVEQPEAAVALLRPNAMVSRRYTHETTGRSLHLLLVQCGDARDMEGHYPPNCYPGAGWQLQWVEPFAIEQDAATVRGHVYHFQRAMRGLPEELTVMNVVMLPDGRFGDRMTEIRRLAGSYRERFFGAGQVQLVFNGSWTASEREAVAATFLKAAEPAMNAVLRLESAIPEESLPEPGGL